METNLLKFVAKFLIWRGKSAFDTLCTFNYHYNNSVKNFRETINKPVNKEGFDRTMKKRKTIGVLVCLLLIGMILCNKAIEHSPEKDYQANDTDNNQTSTETITFTQGTYHFSNKQDTRYLSYSNGELMMSDTPATWKVERASVGFYIYAGDNDLVFDIDNALVTSGNKVKLWEVNGYDVQKWKIVTNSNGTYTFLSCANENYCLGLVGGKTVLQLRDDDDASQEWNGVAVVDNTLKKYVSFTSQQGIFDVRLPVNVTDVISESRLQEWANNLEKAYFSFYDLTNYKPFDYIRVEAYKPFTKHTYAMGYVLNGVNIIYVDSDLFLKDLAKMANRENDWNFCVLHEMGHMFDFDRPWNFEAEAMTDIKISYVLEQHSAGAELSSTGNESVRYGKDIMKSYKQMQGNLSVEYDIFACAYKFLQIKEQIGWEPIKQAFHKLQSEEALYKQMSQTQKFETFVNTISDYSNKNIKEYFTTAEWNSIIEELN